MPSASPLEDQKTNTADPTRRYSVVTLPEFHELHKIQKKETLWQSFLQLLDLSFWHDPCVCLLCLSRFLGTAANSTFFVFMPSALVSVGFSLQQASLLLTVIGIVNTASRVLVGFVMDHPKINVIMLTAIGIALQALTLFIFPYCNDYVSLMVLGGVIGVVSAPLNVSLSIMLGELLPVEKLASSFAKMAVSQGFGGVAGPTLAGSIYDYTKSFKLALIMAAIGYAAAAMACGLVAYLHYKQKKGGIENEQAS